MAQAARDDCEKALKLVVGELVREILEEKLYPNVIGKRLKSLIGDYQYEKLKVYIKTYPREKWRISWNKFIRSVPGVRRYSRRFAVDQSTESSRLLFGYTLVVKYRKELLLEIVSILLNGGFDNINHQGKNGNTILHLIASLPIETKRILEFQTELLKLVVNKRPDCSLKNNQEMTPIHIITGNCILDSQNDFVISEQRGLSCEQSIIGRLEKLKCMESILERPFSVRRKHGNSILHEWVLYCALCDNMSNKEQIIGDWIISTLDVKANVVNVFGCTPLHYAFNTDLIGFLCGKGADTGRKNVDGDVPLLFIIKRSLFTSVSNTLPDNGKIERFANGLNLSPNSYPLKQFTDDKKPKFENMKINVLEMSCGFNLSESDDQKCNSLDVLLLAFFVLSENFKDLSADGIKLFESILTTWIKTMTSSNGPLNDKTSKNKTLLALLTAFFTFGSKENELKASKLILECVKELLEGDADPNLKISEQQKPLLHYCCSNAVPGNHLHSEVLEMLCEYGADKTDQTILQSCDDHFRQIVRNTELKRRVEININSLRYKSRLDSLCRQANPTRIKRFRYDRDSIGKGAMSSIFLSIDEKSKRELALKRMEKNCYQSEFKAECEALLKLEQNPNVVNFYGLEEDDNFNYIEIELMDGDLQDLVVQKRQYLDKAENTCKLAAGVVDGLAFLHEHKMIHRDIKPGNILYREKPEMLLKLADFGLAKNITPECTSIQSSVFSTAKTSLCGTRGWMAPELVTRKVKESSRSSDMFSLGLALHFLFSKGYHPFHSSTVTLQVELTNGSFKCYELEAEIGRGRKHIRNDLTPEQRLLIYSLLNSEPKKRPESRDLTNKHCYFWSNLKKVKFMWMIGDQPEVATPARTPSTFGSNLNSLQYGNFSNWHTHISALYQELSTRRSYDTSSVLGLIRFFRNAYAHYEERSPARKVELLNDEIFKVFRTFFAIVWAEVQEVGWMEQAGGREMLRRIYEIR